jgi:uncharacterized protein YwqG
MDELFIKTVDEFIKNTSVPYIKINAKRGETSPIQSKFGGIPYIPEGFAYPYDKITNKPLRLIAQINFAEMPLIEYFPQRGILQFFIRDDFEYEEKHGVSLGVDYDNPTKQDGWRIIYHENITKQSSKGIPQFPKIPNDDSYFPLFGEFILSFEKKNCSMPINDFRFNNEFLKIYKKYIKTDANRIDNIYIGDGDKYLDLDDKERGYLYETFQGLEHRIGGYPDFVQWDQRDEYHIGHAKYTDYSILLLQINSQLEVDKWCDICWCDGGIANIFIRPEDLRKQNFSNILYTWDCG